MAIKTLLILAAVSVGTLAQSSYGDPAASSAWRRTSAPSPWSRFFREIPPLQASSEWTKRQRASRRWSVDNWAASLQTVRHSGLKAYHGLIDLLIDWLIDWFIHWLIDWLLRISRMFFTISDAWISRAWAGRPLQWVCQRRRALQSDQHDTWKYQCTRKPCRRPRKYHERR